MIRTCYVGQDSKLPFFCEILLTVEFSENFIPFDLENLFASLFTVKSVSAVFPQKPLENNLINSGKDILDDLILRGNRTAQFRKSEIQSLENLIALIPTASGNSQSFEPFQTNRSLFNVAPVNLQSNVLLDQEIEECTDRDFGNPGAILDSLDQCAGDSFDIFDASEEVGLMSNQVLSVINQLTDDLPTQENTNPQVGSWFWDAC